MAIWVSEQLQKKFDGVCGAMLEKIEESGIAYESVGIFGSYARREFTLRSDVDMCIVVDKLPDRAVKGWLYNDAEELGVDLIFVTKERFETERSLFMTNLRRDYVELRGKKIEN